MLDLNDYQLEVYSHKPADHGELEHFVARKNLPFWTIQVVPQKYKTPMVPQKSLKIQNQTIKYSIFQNTFSKTINKNILILFLHFYIFLLKMGSTC